MSTLTWNASLTLQQPRMDQTHREFVDLLAELEARLDDPPEALAAALDRFIAHTQDHFDQEDRWMARLGFAPQSCHPLQHAQVLELLHEVRRRLQADADLAVVRALVPALAEWFPIHAGSMDAGLAQAMQECGFDPETGAMASPQAPAPPRSGCGSTHCG